MPQEQAVKLCLLNLNQDFPTSTQHHYVSMKYSAIYLLFFNSRMDGDWRKLKFGTMAVE